MQQKNRVKDLILEAIKDRIRVQDSSRDNVACFCPFHKGGNETRPSFFIYAGEPKGGKVPGMSFCHTCNSGWSLKTLLYSLNAPRLTIDLISKEIPEAGAVFSKRPTLQERLRNLSFENPILPEVLLGVYDYCPNSLLKQGFKMETLKKFDIGFDRYTGRITFPLRDHLGNLVGFSGRALNELTLPRYLVYRREDLLKAGSEDKELTAAVSQYTLHKGRFLWGLHEFYTTAMLLKIPYIILVEGFKQAMWLTQANFPFTVATMGTHLTEEQATLVSRLGCPIYVFLDNDEPGRNASYKVTRWLKRQNPYVQRIRYPTGSDGLSPDDLAPELLQKHLQEEMKWAM